VTIVPAVEVTSENTVVAKDPEAPSNRPVPPVIVESTVAEHYSVEEVNPFRLIGAGCTAGTRVDAATVPRGSTRRIVAGLGGRPGYMAPPSGCAPVARQ
jgi:hypothetical protein